MGPRFLWVRSREARWLLSAAWVAVAVAYQVRRPVEVSVGSGLLSAFLTHGFHEAEGGYRWTRVESTLHLPDVGSGISGRLEIDVSGFRPPGLSPPLLYIDASRSEGRFQTTRRIERVELPVKTETAALDVRFRSETFTPGPHDRRALGVRVHRVKWIPDAPAVVLSRPPLRAIFATALAGFFLYGVLRMTGASKTKAFRAALALEAALALAFSLARVHAAVLGIASALFFGGAALAIAMFPALSARFGRASVEAVRCLRDAVKIVRTAGSVLLVLSALGLVFLAYRARTSFTVDLGSGRETTRALRFGSYDSEGGVTFRTALPGATLDLRDFGGGTLWTISTTAAEGADWVASELEERSPFGWRSGLALPIAGGSRVDRVRVDRGRSLPSLKILFAVGGSVLALAVALAAAGVSRTHAFVSGSGLLLLVSLGIYLDPVLVIPFMSTFFAVTAGAAVLAAVTIGGVSSFAIPVPRYAIALATVGFMVALSSLVFPLYRGLHFAYHSSIAEEIWQGRFWVYYFPHAENILSREAQWGGIVVPYPCFYHLLISPLAALPREAFYTLEKVSLAVMVFSMALVSALLARHFGSERAAAAASLFTVSLYPVYQLFGLGHLLTLFGCWAATLALGYLALRVVRLERKDVWWRAAGLLTLCFLSYTASLLFAGFSVALAVFLLARGTPAAARALAGCAVLATFVSLLLYYGHWIRPFIQDSLPLLLAPDPSGVVPVMRRLAALPGKLSYSFGSPLVPMAGLLGLAWARRGAGRLVLWSWALVLPFFSGVDVFFNFILKHHYFVMVTVSLGSALLWDRLSQKNAWAKTAATVFFVYWIVSGAEAALDVALGKME